MAVHLPPPSTVSPTLDVPACAADDFETLPVKRVIESAAAQLQRDRKLIKPDVVHVIDQYLQVFWGPKESEADAGAAGGYACAQPSC